MTVVTDRRSLLLPEGTRLVHIGPHKTGTTSLQSAFHARRAEVRRQGVRYAGRSTQPVAPVMAVTGHTQPIYGPTPPPIKTWKALVHEIVSAREPRVLLSSEYLCEASPESIATIVRDLDATRVHIVVTLRPLAKILPSQWQQFVQAGTRTSYDDFLVSLFDGKGEGQAPLFWRRHRHDELIARWVAVAGVPNVTVVAVDDRDHSMVLRVFEELTGLREGTLETTADRANRSLTYPEVEVVRAFNLLALDESLDRALQAKLMRHGAAAYMKQRDPGPDEARIATPGWALEAATDVAREMVGRITASGVRVVGDLDAMAAMPRRSAGGGPEADPVILPEIAARTAIGIVVAAGLAKGTGANQRDASTDLDPDARSHRAAAHARNGIDLVPTIQLGSVLVKRGRLAASRGMHRIRRGRR